MNCPVCGGTVCVTRNANDCEAVFRRRKCDSCGYVFFTEERETDSAKTRYYEIENDNAKERSMKGFKFHD